MLNITIDDREKKIIKYYQEYDDNFTTWKVERLKIGDFIICNGNKRIIIERKTLKDLSSSIKDRRIYNQINNLKNQKDIFCFIIEGSINEYIILQKNKINHLLPVTSIKTRLKHMKEEGIIIFYSKNILDTINNLEVYIPVYFSLFL